LRLHWYDDARVTRLLVRLVVAGAIAGCSGAQAPADAGAAGDGGDAGMVDAGLGGLA